MLKELSEAINSIKKIQSETKNSLIEIKNNLQGNNNKVDDAENQINDMEHKEATNNQAQQPEGKRVQRNEGGISNLWNNFRRSNIHIIGVPEGEEKDQKLEIYSKK